jgi:hypothetical protein
MTEYYFVEYVNETGEDCTRGFATVEQVAEFIANIEATADNIHIYTIDGEEISL